MSGPRLVKEIRHVTSRMEKETILGSLTLFSKEVSTAFTELEEPDINTSGVSLPGNFKNKALVQVTFVSDNQDERLEHGLGVLVSNYYVVKKSEKADFWDGDRQPDENGLWLRTDTAGVTARFMVFGQDLKHG